MARIRSVHPGLTSDESFMSMSMAAKAAWAPLWMQCDDHGIFEWKPIVLKARIFPADNVDFAEILAEFVRLDCVKMIDIGGKPHGVVRNFRKYQKPKHPSYRYYNPKDGKELPADLAEYIEFKPDDSPEEGESSPSPPPGLPQHYGKSSADGVGVGEGVKEERKKTRASALGDWPEDYQSQFWAMWPNKVGKPAAMTKLEAVRKSGTSWSQLSAGIEKYIRSKPPDRPWLNPATFLNQRRFEDEPAAILPFPSRIDMDEICPPSIYQGAL